MKSFVIHWWFRVFCVLVFTIPDYLPVTAQQADAAIDSLNQLLGKSKPDSGRLNLLIELGYTMGSYDPEAALVYGNQSMALAKQLQDALGQGIAAYLLFNIYLNLGEYRKASLMLDTAATHFESANRPDKIARIYNGRGNLSYMQSDLYAAAEYFSKASEQFRMLRDTTNEIIAFQNMIATLGETKSFDRANQLSKKLLPTLLQRGDTLQASRAWHNIILNNLSLEQPDSAKPYVYLLHNYIEHASDLNIVSESYNAIGRYYDYVEKYDSALYCFNMALQKAIKQNYQPALFYLSIGVTYLKMNQSTKAIYYLKKADSLAIEANSPDIENSIRFQMALYYKQVGNYKSAFESLLQHKYASDSLLGAETRAYASKLEAAFETGKKEEEILTLKKTEFEKTLAVRKRNNWIVILGILFFSSMITAFLIWRNQQIKKRLFAQQNLLQQQKITAFEKERQNISLQAMITGQETERIRIARDLHDGLGGLFSTVKMYFSSLGHRQPILAEDELFKKSVAMLDNTSDEVRRIAHNLMPEVLMKFGLVKAVEELCNQVNKGGLIEISLQAYNMDARIASSTEIMLYRILQELLNNIIKHADASQVIVQFNRHAEKLSVTVEDNGRGFNATQQTERSTAGIETIKSRVNYLNGFINIDSKTGVGTTVIMEFLLNEE